MCVCMQAFENTKPGTDEHHLETHSRNTQTISRKEAFKINLQEEISI